MADRPTRIGGLGIGLDQVGGQITDLAREVALIRGQLASDESLGVGLPEVDSSFTPTFETIAGELFVNLAYFIPGYAAELRVWMIRDDLVTSNAAYHLQRFKDSFVLSDEDRTAFPASVEARFEKPLKANKTYHVILLDAFDFNDNIHSNPETPPKYVDFPGNVLFTFSTGAAVNEPGKPSLARLIKNEIQITDDGLIPVVTARVYADEAETLTFAEQQVTGVQVKFQDTDVTTTKPKRFVAIDDPTVTFIDIEMGSEVALGREYSWLGNQGWSGDESATATPASPVTFFAGGFGDPADLSGFVLVAFTAEPTESPNELNIVVEATQPTPPRRLKNHTAQKKVSVNADSDYDLEKNLIVDHGLLLDPIYNVAGSIFVKYRVAVKAAKTYKIRDRFRFVGGVSKDLISGDISSEALAVSARETAGSGGLSDADGAALVASVKQYQDYQNTLDGSGAGAAGDADFPGRVWQTFTNSTVLINNRASGVGGNTLDARGIRWMNADKRLLLSTTIFTLGGAPSIRLGKLYRANDRVGICPLFLAAAGTVTITVTFALVDQVAGDMATVAIPLVVSSTEPTKCLGIMTVDPAYVGTNKQWLELRFPSNPSQTLYYWNPMLEKSIFFRDFKANADEQAVLNYIDASANSSGSSAGVIVTEDDEGNQIDPDGNPGGQIFLT